MLQTCKKKKKKPYSLKFEENNTYPIPLILVIKYSKILKDSHYQNLTVISRKNIL